MALASVTSKETIGMEWERNIEAGTSVLHDDIFCLFLQKQTLAQRYIDEMGFTMFDDDQGQAWGRATFKRNKKRNCDEGQSRKSCELHRK